MAYEFRSDDQLTIFTCSKHHWLHLQKLAGQGGWQPLGTRPPDDWSKNLVWPRLYNTKDGQHVTQDDALAMVTALEFSLDDIPDVRTAPLLLILTTDLSNPYVYDITEYEQNRSAYGIPDDIEITVMNEDDYRNNLYSTPPTILIASTTFELSSVDVFSGVRGKAFINHFIDFAHLGGFAIY